MYGECNLQIEQNIRFQEREWQLQRLGWIVFAAIVIAAVLGLFGGGGVFAQKRVDSGSGLALEFSRFERRGAFAKLRIDVEPTDPSRTEFSIWIDRRYLQDMDVENITPTPVRTEFAGDRLHFVFHSRANEMDKLTEAGPYRITFMLKANHFGITEGKIGLVDGANTTIRFRQLFYP